LTNVTDLLQQPRSFTYKICLIGVTFENNLAGNKGTALMLSDLNKVVVL